MEDDRPGEEEPIRGHLAALPVGAAIAFFARYAQRHDIARAERVAAREAICAELEALRLPPVVSEPAPAEQAPEAEPPADLVATVRGLRGRWQQELAARGVDRERALRPRSPVRRRRSVASCARWPAAFAGTDLDPDANRRRMESAGQTDRGPGRVAQGGPADAAALSPTTQLAAMLKEALAANTIGGKVDDESRRRAAQEDVRQAQASWSRIGPVPDDIRRALADRFQRALRRVSEAG